VGFNFARRKAPGTSSASVVRKFLRSIWVGKSLPNAEKSSSTESRASFLAPDLTNGPKFPGELKQ
jgi:hypothetical protein